MQLSREHLFFTCRTWNKEIFVFRTIFKKVTSKTHTDTIHGNARQVAPYTWSVCSSSESLSPVASPSKFKHFAFLVLFLPSTSSLVLRFTVDTLNCLTLGYNWVKTLLLKWSFILGNKSSWKESSREISMREGFFKYIKSI